MTTHPRFLRLLAGLALAGAVALAGVAPVTAADRYEVDVARRADFVPQTNFVQCVGASLQMMINMIEPGRDRSARTQLRLQKLARKLSPPRRDGAIRQGASVRGWVKVLQREVDQPYRARRRRHAEPGSEASGARNRADRCAGRLARVARPARLGDERVRGDKGPGRRWQGHVGHDLRPAVPLRQRLLGTEPQARRADLGPALGRQFVPRRTNNNSNAFQTTLEQAYPTLSGKYVLVLPYVPHVPVRRPA